MTKQAACTLTVYATLNDPIDGIMRLVGDVQRFGFGLLGLCVDAICHEAACALSMTLSVPVGMDEDTLKARLSRHPAVLEIRMMVPARVHPRDSTKLVA